MQSFLPPSLLWLYVEDLEEGVLFTLLVCVSFFLTAPLPAPHPEVVGVLRMQVNSFCGRETSEKKIFLEVVI